jgi:DUF177 domain-containing protein
MTTFTLRALKLRSGEAYRDELPVELTPLALGGQRYQPEPTEPQATLAITRTTSGLVLELSFETVLTGPCVRCLEDASVELGVRTREYHEPSATSEELRTPYLTDGRLDLSSWARDALAFELPEQILCSAECAGLCAGCGANLNVAACSCPPAEPDPRFAKLAELRQRLGG